VAYNFRGPGAGHGVPRLRGGQDADESLQLLCGHCSRVKGKGMAMPELGVELVRTGVLGRRAAP